MEQKNIQKQAKLDKKQNKDNETKRKALAMSAKKEKIKQIQQQKLYDQSLTYVCKLFKTIK
jgi:oligoribonuclease NrnB/cAMP/cGMP phosphodiesterase (DHH superfamily)